MAKFILRRLGFMLFTMFLVSLAIFLISELAPGDVDLKGKIVACR